MRAWTKGLVSSATLGLLLGSALVNAAAPIANPDSVTTPAGVAVTIPVLANDSDPDGNTFSISAFPARPVNGSVTRSTTAVRYTPKAGFSGVDTFVYRIKDSTNRTADAQVTVTVTAPVNTAPVAGADSASTVSPNPVTINLLANDTDANGDTLSVTANTAPANGTVTRTGGSATYTPAAGFSGSDSFAYTLSDGNGGTATGTATVSVSAAPAPPPAATAGSAILSWSIPTTRADGSPIAISEIAGYEIYVLAEGTGVSSVITVTSGTTTTYTVTGLSPDTYDFSMAAKDTAGNLSALSPVVAKIIAP